MQILPAIDIRGGQCVRLRQGDYSQETVFSDDPVEMAKRWADEGAERLHLVDLDGARAGQPVNLQVIEAITSAVSIPCQLGGGLRSETALETILEKVGLDRAIVGTQALKQPDWFREMTARFPGKIALGLDAKGSKVATGGWLEVSQTPAIDLARSYAGLNLAALIYTNIANDGMMQGIDEATISDMVELTKLGFPVIASGGVSRLEDVRRLAETSREHPKLIGAIIGRAIYEGSIRIKDAIAITG